MGIVIIHPAMGSALDEYRHLVAGWCRENKTDAEIIRRLHAAGCGFGRERIRTWLLAETETGRLPARIRSGRGRPPKKPAKKSSADGQPLASSALSLLDDPHPALDEMDIVSVLEGFGTGSSQGKMHEGAIMALGVPETDTGEVDLRAWARQLSVRKVVVSDLEWFALASLQPPWKDHQDRWSRPWIRGVREAAIDLRRRMAEFSPPFAARK